MKWKRLVITYIKHNAFGIVALLLIMSALPVSILQIGKVTGYKASASHVTLVPYPGLSWDTPHEYTTTYLQEEGTPEEELKYTKGEVVTSVTRQNLSKEIYSFYETLLTSKGFSEVQRTGNPGLGDEKSYWTITYQNDYDVCQIQYYPTPYSQDSYTVQLFFGNI